jgi:hypothetical protein
MRIYGTLKEVVSLWFKKNTYDVKVEPNGNTYEGATTFVLPPKTSGSGTLVGESESQALTNKTLDADLNTITNIENSDIKAGAAIDRTKLASGTASHVLINDGSGVFSSEAQLATSRGGTGVNSTATFPASGVLVTEAGSQTLTNKTISGASNTLSNISLTSSVTGTLPISNGGSGQTSANAALNAFLPSQASATNKYLKSDGTNTSWASASGGAGEINAILNASGADGTTGWTGTTVVSGASSPLNPIVTTAFSIANSATTESSTSGGYYPFTMPSGLLNRKLKVEFTFTTPATDVYAVSIYQGSTRVALSTDSSSVTTLPASVTGGKFTAYFDTDSNTSWTLSITRTSGSTGACVITNVIVGPGIQPQGAVVGEWISYTPTLENFTVSGTNALNSGKWRRNGQNIDIDITIRMGSTGTATPAITFKIHLPAGYTIDTSAAPSQVSGTRPNAGSGLWYDDSAAQFKTITPSWLAPEPTKIVMVLPGTGSQLGQGSECPTNCDDRFSFTISVPIAEWAGSGTVNVAQNDVEFAYNTSATTANDTTSFGYGPQGVLVQSFAPSGTTGIQKRVRFQTPIQSGDQLQVELSSDGGITWFPNSVAEFGFSRNDAGNTSYGIGLNIVDTTTADIRFYSQATPGASWSGYTAYRWRVRKSSSGAAVGFGIADTISSGLVPSGTYNKSTGAWTLGPSGFTGVHTLYGNMQIGTGALTRGRINYESTTGQNRILLNHEIDSVASYGFGVDSSNDLVLGTNSGVDTWLVKGVTVRPDGTVYLGPRTTWAGEVVINSSTSNFGIIDLTVNSSFGEFTGQDTNRQGGLFRLDTRDDVGQSLFRWYARTPGTALATLTEIGRATAAGVWSNIAGGSWATISDARLKENVENLDSGLAMITGLRPVSYSWKDENVSSLRPTKGFIAQEVEQVNPKWVQTSGEETITVGGEEQVIENVKQVHFDTSFNAYLVKAIQELKEELDLVKAELDALKG